MARAAALRGFGARRCAREGEEARALAQLPARLLADLVPRLEVLRSEQRRVVRVDAPFAAGRLPSGGRIALRVIRDGVLRAWDVLAPVSQEWVAAIGRYREAEPSARLAVGPAVARGRAVRPLLLAAHRRVQLVDLAVHDRRAAGVYRLAIILFVVPDRNGKPCPVRQITRRGVTVDRPSAAPRRLRKVVLEKQMVDPVRRVVHWACQQPVGSDDEEEWRRLTQAPKERWGFTIRVVHLAAGIQDMVPGHGRLRKGCPSKRERQGRTGG